MASEYEKDKGWVHGVLGGRCRECGRYDHRAMHVDHIDASNNPVRWNGSKGGTGWDVGMGHALKLLKAGDDITVDFQLLCAWCHAIKTHEERKAVRRDPYQLDLFSSANDNEEEQPGLFDEVG